MKAELVTKSEYARMRGVQPSAVTKAINDGRITLVGDKIDPSVADIQWAQNTRARIGASPQQSQQQRPAAPEKEAGGEGDYWASRARREHAEADMAELKLQESLGELVRSADVRSALSRRAAAVREGLLQIPARLAPVLAAETDQARIYTAIDTELRTVLAQITEGL